MSARRNFALFLPFWLGFFCVREAATETPQEAARRAMEESVARQRLAVSAMQIPIERQRAAVAGAVVSATPAATSSRPAAPPPVAPAGIDGEPFFALSWPAQGPACEPLPEMELAALITQAARQEGLDAALLRAVARRESGFRACAISQKGAMGLMQLMPATAQELGVRDPFDAGENLLSGARLLKQMLERYHGDVALALSAYNAGPARVSETGGVPSIPETLGYVQRILSELPVP